MPALRLVNSLMSFGLLGGLCLIWVQVRRPPIGGSASSKIVTGVISSSTTAWPLYRLSCSMGSDFPYVCFQKLGVSIS